MRVPFVLSARAIIAICNSRSPVFSDLVMLPLASISVKFPRSSIRLLGRRSTLDGDVCGNLIPDAYLAASAIESGSEFISTDRDFNRFTGLRWHLPF